MATKIEILALERRIEKLETDYAQLIEAAYRTGSISRPLPPPPPPKPTVVPIVESWSDVGGITSVFYNFRCPVCDEHQRAIENISPSTSQNFRIAKVCESKTCQRQIVVGPFPTRTWEERLSAMRKAI
jgi:hypothetical protein